MVDKKFFVYLDKVCLVMALEEDDFQLPTRAGTFMLGVNNEAVEFSDISTGMIPIPKGDAPAPAASAAASAAAPGAAVAAPASASAAAPASAANFEEDLDLSSESMFTVSDPNALLNPTGTCTSKLTCIERNAWCTEVFGASAPSDCVETFTDLCCSENAKDNLVQCKNDVPAVAGIDVGYDNFILNSGPSCFVQAGSVAKESYDACVACCNEKLNECYSDNSRSGCQLHCSEVFPYQMDIVVDPSGMSVSERGGVQSVNPSDI